MTDNEIVKVLECCKSVDIDGCKDCPIRGENCINIILTNSLDLINRQKAEIDMWKEGANHYQNLWCKAEADAQEARAEPIKKFVEGLKKSAFACDVSFGYGREHYTEVVAVVEIDNLVKEMTEGEK